ncbi:hypothetical protein SNE40_009690 [Patella caerulea]|uniref:Reverse transcriptase domain-containing protein n=1 Tax=Patella caerulea TaxID=87958 RepID=A0AAN8JRS1_PATCE
MVTYTSEQLLSLNNTDLKLKPGVFNIIKFLNINSVKPTKRSRRGGKKFTAYLSTLNTDQETPNKSELKSVNNDKLKLCLLNSRSVRNKSIELNQYILDESIDILLITETWLKDNDTIVINEILPPDYDILFENRQTSRGGGLGIIFRQSLSLKQFNSSEIKSFKSFEHIGFNLRQNNVSVQIIALYRPPPSAKNKLNFQNFEDEFLELICDLNVTCTQPLFFGDFNIHVDNVLNNNSLRFTQILDSFGLKQLVAKPTHGSGHTLDLVICKSTSKLVTNVNVCNHELSDHFSVFVDLNLSKPAPTKTELVYRNCRNINIGQFIEDINIETVLQNISVLDSVDDKWSVFNQALYGTLDRHAPLKKRIVTIRPHSKWFNDSLLTLKHQCRSAETNWRRSGLEVHLQIYKCKRNQYSSELRSTKIKYLKDLITTSNNSKTLFQTFNNLTKDVSGDKYPSCFDKDALPEIFSNFFISKINKIRDHFPDVTETEQHISLLDSGDDSNWLTFNPVSLVNIEKIIRNAPTKSCDLDAIPTWLLKICLPHLLQLLFTLINDCISSSQFPTAFKTAHVRPLLKKLNLDPDCLRNYRPVSNLSFLSKVIEKVIAEQLKEHLTRENLSEPFQSAYRDNHSCETALIRVSNDLLRGMDKKCVILFVLLDLSAAFDTIDHHILLHRLKYRLKLSDSAIKLIQSYLSNRNQIVCIDNAKSNPAQVKFGVPQGSVLGPILFTIYTSPLGEIIRKHCVDYHLFADDTQLYLIGPPCDIPDKQQQLERCIESIRVWMTANFLKLNSDKTEYMTIGSKSYVSSLDSHPIQVGIDHISPVQSARNLGVMFNSTMDMSKQIAAVSKACNFQLYNIGRVRKYLNTDSIKLLVNSLIASRLDYCNSLLYGLPASSLRSLQKIQNTAARLITRTRLRDHITPVLKSLHWLPINRRIQYKIILLTYKCIHGSAPNYLSHLIKIKSGDRSTRSTSKHDLVVPKTFKVSCGDRAFSVAAPTQWNKLPATLKEAKTVESFKTSLKTHLFNCEYQT